MIRACLILVWTLAGCNTAPKHEAAATPPSASQEAAKEQHQPSAPTSDPAPGQQGPPLEVVPEDPREDALLLAHGVRNRLADGSLGPWLATRATYPFDLDGKEVAPTSEALTEKLPGYVETWAKQTAGQSRCEALTREDLMAGKPLHYLDRLGTRPPAAELARDLDRFGLDPGELFVNCYTPDKEDAGYTLIVVPTKDGPRIEAFRN